MRNPLLWVIALVSIVQVNRCFAGFAENLGGYKVWDVDKSDMSHYTNLDKSKQQSLYEATLMASSGYPDERRNDYASTGYQEVSKDGLNKIASNAGLKVYEQPVRQTVNGQISETGEKMLVITGNKNDRLNARVFEKADGTIAVVYCGTDGFGDILDDAKQLVHVAPTPQAYKDSAALLKSVMDAYPDRNINVYGHSEGGGEAQYAVLVNGVNNGGGKITCTGINSAGLNGLTTVNTSGTKLTKDEISESFTLVVNSSELVSKAGYQFGELVVVDDLAGDSKVTLKSGRESDVNGAHGVEETGMKMEKIMSGEQTVDSGVGSRMDAVKFALDGISNQLGKLMPTEVQVLYESIREKLTDGKLSDENRKALIAELQKAVTKYLPYDNSAKTLNGILQQIADGNAVDVLDEIPTLGISVGADILKQTLTKNLDKDVADQINAIIDGAVQNGAQGALDAAVKDAEALIDKYAPGQASADQLKGTMHKILDGTVQADDFVGAATSLASDSVNKLIDESDLPPEVKDLTKKAVAGALEDGVGGMIDGIGDFAQDYVTDKLGKEAGDAVGGIFDQITTPNGDPWQAIEDAAPVVGKAIQQKVLAKAEACAAAQIDKLIAKYPTLKLVLGKLGIDGAGIVNGIKNVFGVLFTAPNLSEALSQLGTMAANFFRDVATKLVQWAIDWAVGWLTDTIVPKVATWASKTLAKWAEATGGIVGTALTKLKELTDKYKQAGQVKIKTAGAGAKVVGWAEAQIKKRTSKQDVVIQSDAGGKHPIKVPTK